MYPNALQWNALPLRQMDNATLLSYMHNVASIYEGDTEYRPFLLAVNAEVEHFNQILNRKGKGNSGTGDNTGGGTDTPGTDTPPSGGGNSDEDLGDGD